MPSRRTAMATLLWAGVGAACRDVPDREGRRVLALDEIAERYVRLTLKLAQHQPSLVEAWLGPDAWQPGARVPVAGIQGEIDETADALRSASPPAAADRSRYLAGQLRGLTTAARRLSGEAMRFADEAQAAFGVPRTEWESDRDAERAAREELEMRLAGSGPLHERYTAFRRRHAIGPDRILPTLQAAAALCRDLVATHVALPESERVVLETAAGEGFEGRSVYEGRLRSRVTIDASGPLDLARALWLTAHETYPGHHLQHVLADRDVVSRNGWQERALFPLFGPHLIVAEGAAETGAALLLQGDRFHELAQTLAPTAGTSAAAITDLVAVHRAVMALDRVIPAVAAAYLDGAIGSETAGDRLRDEALVPNARAFLQVIERQRTRVLAYPVGRRLVRRAIDAVPSDKAWTRLAAIASRMLIDSL